MAFAIDGAARRLEFLHHAPSGPIALPVSPFDFPQFPKRCWRVVGAWKHGGEFLVVLGASEIDAIDRLYPALAPLSRRELWAIRALWLERWSPGSRVEFPSWEPVRAISLKRIRFRRTIRDRRRRAFGPAYLRSPFRKGVA
jgi:hypothetical protein